MYIQNFYYAANLCVDISINLAALTILLPNAAFLTELWGVCSPDAIMEFATDATNQIGQVTRYLDNPTPELAAQTSDIVEEFRDAGDFAWDDLTLEERSREFINIHTRNLELIRNNSSSRVLTELNRHIANSGSSSVLQELRNMQGRR